MKVTKDLIAYLEHIDTLSKKLPITQRKVLENILTVILNLLVALKRDSKLGKFSVKTMFGDVHFDDK